MKLKAIVTTAVLIFTGFMLSDQVSAQSAEELQRQLDEMKQQMGVSDPAAELQRTTGLAQSEMQELSRLCGERHGSDYNAASECVMQAMQNAREDRQRTTVPTVPGIPQQAREAQSRPTQPTSGWVENVFSAQGSPCVSLAWLDQALQTSTKENCPAKNEYGSCRDIKHRAEFTNNCDSNIDVKWLFSTKYSNWSQVTLKPGKPHLVSCLQSLDQCNGKIQWAVRAK